jgi:hypothetical protein
MGNIPGKLNGELKRKLMGKPPGEGQNFVRKLMDQQIFDAFKTNTLTNSFLTNCAKFLTSTKGSRPGSSTVTT